MKYKKGLIFIFLIILLISIVNVSANDVNETVIANECQNDDLIKITDQNIISDNEVNKISTESEKSTDDIVNVDDNIKDNITTTEDNNVSASFGTYTNLASRIANSNGELNISADYYYSNGESYSGRDLSNGILINKPIIINGNGFSINGNNMARAFYIKGNNIILKNINFEACSSSPSFSENNGATAADGPYGGAIYWSGNNGKLINCTFTNNGATAAGAGYGGAIYWSGNNGKLINCTFINCIVFSNDIETGENNAYSLSSGGAIYLSGKNNSIENCTFTNCKSSASAKCASSKYRALAEGNGGAIYIEGPNSIYNCKFIKCSTISRVTESSIPRPGSIGGAIYIYAYEGFCDVSNCSFIDCLSTSSSDSNQAYSIGGGIYCVGEGKLSNSEFINCSCISKSDLFGSLDRCYGGAFSFKTFSQKIPTIDLCTFKNNSAKYGGAGHLLDEDLSDYSINISRSIFLGNKAFQGHCMYCEDGGGSIEDSIIISEPGVNPIYSNYPFTANYNWWGNTFEDYDVRPNSAYIVKIDNWLFLNLTVDKKSLNIGEYVKIKFDLTNLFNNGNICKYDAFKAVNIKFTIIDDNTVGFFKVNNGLDELIYLAKESPKGHLIVKYENIEKLFEFDIKKIIPSINVPNINTVHNVAKNLVITLTANDKPLANQKVTIKMSTISNTLTTNTNGQIFVEVSKLTPKTYTATIIYDGDSTYAGISANAKVVVNKANPKLITKKKTFKKSVKTKKYSITLKNNQNKVMKNTKVTIKLNKKTYTAKTNSKGIATFKITKLTKKGTFKAAVTYKGNKYYNKVTKKVYIKIK